MIFPQAKDPQDKAAGIRAHRQGAHRNPYGLRVALVVALSVWSSACAPTEPTTAVGGGQPTQVESNPLPKAQVDTGSAYLDPTKPLPDTIQLVFGVYKTDKATELYRMFLPVLEAVQVDLSNRLDLDIGIELRIFGTYEEGLQALVENQVDFVRFGPTSYVLAKDLEPSVQLLAKESKKGKGTFKGVICVKQDSSYQTLEDLRGSRFAFGNMDSTIGRYLAQNELLNAGIFARDLQEHTYLAQHDMVAKAVSLGDYDAGALKESTYEKVNSDSVLRKLHSFDNITKPWVASSTLHPELVAGLKETLLQSNDPIALASLKITGFLGAQDDDYQPVRSAMKRVLAEFDTELAPTNPKPAAK